jgi:amino acid transporter
MKDTAIENAKQNQYIFDQNAITMNDNDYGNMQKNIKNSREKQKKQNKSEKENKKNDKKSSEGEKNEGEKNEGEKNEGEEDNTSGTKEGGLKKSLTLLDLIFFGLGNVTGAGIFVILTKTLLYGGKFTLPIFIAVTLISIIMGFCYLEIYTRYKSPITEYLAIKDTFGDGYGQVLIYTIYLFTVFSCITILIALSKYICTIPLFSFLNKYYYQVGLSTGLILLMSYINYCGIETSKFVGNTIAVALLIFLLGIIFSSLKFFDLKKIQSGPNVKWDSIVLSAIIAFFLFNGYDSIVKISGEVINENDTETGLFATIGLTSVIYIFIIISCICFLGFNKTVNTFSPLTKIYELLYNPTVGFIAYIFGFIIMFNTAFLSALTASRFMYGCGKEKHIAYSDFWDKLNENKAPINSIIITMIISILFSLLNNEVIMSVFTNFSLFIILISICVCVLAIRWNERNDIEKQKKNNYIMGNINNIPVVVIIEIIVLLYLFYSILKNRFYLKK